MSRLSNYTREKMAEALVKHRFAKTAAGLIAEAQDLFRKLYYYHYCPETRKNMAALEKRQKDAFSQKIELTANVGGRRVDVGAVSFGKGEAYWKAEVQPRSVLNDQVSYRSCIGIAADHELAARLTAFDDARYRLREDVEIARREALAALGQFSTGKRLAEDWPEAMPVIGSLIPENDRALPVVQVAGLNAKFGLPPSERLAA